MLHELLHVYMRTHLDIETHMVYEMEERGICAWEEYLYEYISKNPRELESWSQAIRRKLPS